LSAPSTHPSHINIEASDESSNDDNHSDQSDTSPRKLWNPHSGLKPSEEDREASDGKDNNLPHSAVNNMMVEMIANLEDDCDLDWLPFKERQKLERKKTGG
jgi:hypothetical protein